MRDSLQAGKRGLGRLATLLRRVGGMPDYEAYVAHLRARHPGCAIPTRRAYFEEFLRGRYDRPGNRCC